MKNKKKIVAKKPDLKKVVPDVKHPTVEPVVKPEKKPAKTPEEKLLELPKEEIVEHFKEREKSFDDQYAKVIAAIKESKIIIARRERTIIVLTDKLTDSL